MSQTETPLLETIYPTIYQTVLETLKTNGLTISVAESLTGGLLMSDLVNVSGSSEWFKGGIVPYSMESKISLLGTNDIETLKCHGVSEQIVHEMALGAIKMFNTDIGISTSGFAEKYKENESHAYICVVYPEKNICYINKLSNNQNLPRNDFRDYIVMMVYVSLYKILTDVQPSGTLDYDLADICP